MTWWSKQADSTHTKRLDRIRVDADDDHLLSRALQPNCCSNRIRYSPDSYRCLSCTCPDSAWPPQRPHPSTQPSYSSTWTTTKTNRHCRLELVAYYLESFDGSCWKRWATMNYYLFVWANPFVVWYRIYAPWISNFAHDRTDNRRCRFVCVCIRR